MKLFREFCRDHGILHTPEECFSYMNDLPGKYHQISFLEE